MAAHNAPAIYFETLVSLAMLPRAEHDVLVFVTNEKIYPVYYRKAYNLPAAGRNKAYPGPRIYILCSLAFKNTLLKDSMQQRERFLWRLPISGDTRSESFL